MEKKSQYITIKDAADLLGVTPTTLRNWDKAGKLSAHRDPINDYRLYSLEDVSKLLQERRASYEVNNEIMEKQIDLPIFSLPQTEVPPTEKQVFDIRSLRILVRQMSSAFRDSLGGGLIERFEEISKLLYCKLYDEKMFHNNPKYIPVFRVKDGETIEGTYKRVSQLFEKAIALLPDVLNNNQRKLSEDKKAVANVVTLLQNVDLYEVPADVKGIVYEELVKNTYEKSENQQFFTPRVVVEFMVNFLEPQITHRLCDPACGSGGFLIEATNYISKTNSSKRKNLMLEEYLSNNLIGVEIDRRMAWTAQMNLIMHGDGHGNIHHLSDGGSLAFSDKVDSLLPKNSLDLIITNPPFGSDFNDTAHLKKYILGRNKTSRRRGVLFIERCIGWLKPGGRMGIIIDDSVLNGASNRDVRQLMFDNCILEAVISLPDVTFMPYATAKASILFLRKRLRGGEKQIDVFMADVNNVGRKPNGDPLYSTQRGVDGRFTLMNDLPSVINAWKSYKSTGEKSIFKLSPQIFICSGDRIRTDNDLRLDVQFHHPSRKTAEDILRRSVYPTPKLAELVIVRNYTAVPAVQEPDEIWRYIGLGNITANTGEYIVSEALGSQLQSTVRLFRPKDILFAKMRPELRKCVLIQTDEDDGFASSECLILSTVENALNDPDLRDVAKSRMAFHKWQVDAEYLSFILRSDIVYGQLVYQVTGVGRPRVNQSTVLGIHIPLPPINIQREIVATYKLAWKTFLECRNRSTTALGEGDDALNSAYMRASERLCPQP